LQVRRNSAGTAFSVETTIDHDYTRVQSVGKAEIAVAQMAERTEDQKPGRYRFREIEAKWQRFWEEAGTFRTLNPTEPGWDKAKPKFYILDMFPYPSGAGLHVGHPLGYCATDIVARYKRMRGFHVLHPMGFDAFGLPAEQYAIENNVHPAETTRQNIEMYRRQLKMFGFSYDWSREIATCDPAYYKWTQWMFARMFESWYDDECRWTDAAGRPVQGRARPIAELVAELESGRWSVDTHLRIVRSAERTIPSAAEPRKTVLRPWKELSAAERRKVLDAHRLAYVDEVPVNWCPALGTVLANEEVDNEGRSERGGHPIYRRPLRQWMLRITKYAERLLTDIEPLDWPESIKLMQRNWIGRSTGAEVVFPLADRWRNESGIWPPEKSEQVQEGEVARAEARGSGPLPRGRGSDYGRGSGACLFDNRQSAIDNPPDPARPDGIRVYTTRPDTLFGATYMVLAPEHPLVESVTTPEHRDAVQAYVEAARRKSDLVRTAETKEKTGVFTGGYAINPANGWCIPIWIADYVLMGYGTGAIMAVPGSDARDFDFARKYGLSIVAVVRPTREWILERIAALTAGLDAAATAGFRRVAEAFPELAESIGRHREQSADLSEKTKETLSHRVGIDPLIEHYVRHPASWGAAFVEDGTAVNSPGDPSRVPYPSRDREGADEKGTKEITKSLDRQITKSTIANRQSPIANICDLNGLPTAEAKEKICGWLECRGLGRRTVNYKLRDWLFSRQRYWGEPFPILHGEDGETMALPDDELPLELPSMRDFRPAPAGDDPTSMPEPPLGRAREWAVVRRDGKTYRRDLNTMPQWAGSCWYYLRFIDPHNGRIFCDPQNEAYWMPVDLYVGGAEHAVLHLLYARFWHKVLYDLGLVCTPEPFQKLFNQGMIQGFAFRDSRGLTVGPDSVEERGADQFVLRETGQPVTRVVAKMSKSLKNVVNPDEIIAEYGADTFRLYEMYMGPLDASKPWNTRDVPGLFKLCQRIWRLIVDEQTGELSPALTHDPPDDESLRVLHKTIRRVTEDIEQLKFNTAIAALFDFVNAMTPKTTRSRAVVEPFVLILSPFAPHLAEELWQRLGHERSLAYEPWPAHDESLTLDRMVEYGVQINGKLRARITVPADADEDAVRRAATGDPNVATSLEGKRIQKIIVIKGRLVSIVAH
jgi:leucyl-tRNA synthetase